MATKIQVVFYSMYGHIYRMAEAVVAGAREVGDEVALYQVAELVPDDVLEKSGAKAARAAFAQVPLAKPNWQISTRSSSARRPVSAICATFSTRPGGLWCMAA